MGCPPDPIDVGIGRDKTATDDAEQKFKELGEQKEIALKLFQDLNSFAIQNDAVIAIASVVALAIDEPKVPEPEIPSSGMYADAHDAYSKRKYAEQKVKNREQSLCTIRHGILKLAEFIPEEILKQKKNAFDKERELHRLHREDDRETWLRWLEDKGNVWRYFHDKAVKQNGDSAYFTEGVTKISREVARVKALSIDSLLYDNEILGKTSSDFEPDYEKFRDLKD
jgi:hypothetical protein